MLCSFRDGPLENYARGGGGGWGAKDKKNIRAREYEMKKNSCTPINPEKYPCYSLKKIDARNLITKENSCGSKIPHPTPHNFSNGPSLMSIRKIIRAKSH